MPADLVRQAIEQSRAREALVRATALLCGARVLAAVEKEEAKQAFTEGLAVAEGLPPTRHLDFLLHEAVRIGATADPISAVALYRRLATSSPRHMHHHTGTQIVQTLAQAGDFETALEVLEDLALEAGGASIVVHRCSDLAMQRRAMSAARERWRAGRRAPEQVPGQRPDFMIVREFHHLFARHWRKLAPADQNSWLDEILQAIRSDPDQPTNAGFGNRVELHSMRDMHLFEILGALRALKPAAEVEEILQAHPDVEAGSKIYPLGLESLLASTPPMPAGGARRGFIGVGGGSRAGDRMMELALAALQGDRSAVRRMLQEANRLYLEDVNPDDPNLAPVTFWPSCHAYKKAMYWAGKFSGKEAEAILPEIPDRDFAMLASIELAAGMLGLAEHSGVRSEHHPKRFERRRP
jgi:hypothetical protein